jgi:hypothetical protein
MMDFCEQCNINEEGIKLGYVHFLQLGSYGILVHIVTINGPGGGGAWRVLDLMIEFSGPLQN